MPAAIARRPSAVSWLPSLGRITSASTFLLIRVSTAPICWVMSLVGFTASNVTSLYRPAWACAFFAMAAIQPWSAAGAENPMVTARPGAALSPAGGAEPAPGPAAGAALLVHAVSAAPAPTPSAPVRNPRRRIPLVVITDPPSSDPVSGIGRYSYQYHSRGSALRAGLEEHGGDDDRALGDVLDLARQVVQDEQVGDRGEHKHPEDRADQGAPPAGQQGAADDHRGDRIQLVEGAVGAGPGGGQRRDHDRRDAAAQPGDHVEQHRVPPHVEPGQPGGLRVAADGEGAAAERGAVEQYPPE